MERRKGFCLRIKELEKHSATGRTLSGLTPTVPYLTSKPPFTNTSLVPDLTWSLVWVRVPGNWRRRVDRVF